MKILILTVLAVSSFQAISSEMNIQELADESFFITSPRHPGSNLPFSSTSSTYTSQMSSENGVCRALGFERAAEGSSRTNDQDETIRVDSLGRVIGAPYSYKISQIVCLNKINNPLNETSVILKKSDLKHGLSNIAISSASSTYTSAVSSEEGVCKMMGFERAATGSSRTEDQGETVRIDINGQVIGAPYSYLMSRLVCINRISQPIMEVAEEFKSSQLVHPQSNLPFSSASTTYTSATSSEDGVCRVMGYFKAAPGSSRTISDQGDTLRIDSSGKVIGGNYTYKMSRIICIGSVETSERPRGPRYNPPGNQPTSIPVPQAGNRELSTLLTASDLIHPQSRLPFTSASTSYTSKPSSEDGVCRALGFDRAAQGSSRTSNQGDTIRVDSNGSVIGGPYAYMMSQLVCISYR